MQLGQLVVELLLCAQPVFGSCLHEGWVAHRRAKDDDAPLGIRLVASPHFAQFRDPRRSWACFGSGHPSLAQVGCDATPGFDSVHGRVQGGSRAGRLCDNVEVVQESHEAVVDV